MKKINIMAKALIKLAYRQIIDASSTGSFEQKVFHDSYAEFLMKIQAYNPGKKFTTFSEIVANDGRANSLHYKTSFAVLHHIETLQNKIPGLQDEAGRINILFVIPEFKVLESGLADKALHKVAITYITDTITLIDSFGEYLLLSLGDQIHPAGNQELETFILGMQDNLSIINYKEIVSENIFISSQT
ncbi:MAG TPA: hypothetical protein VKC90_14645 [Chitinophagaceae bacterium]|nr:hypothetical protein [Chitinophagaceae bacterium]